MWSHSHREQEKETNPGFSVQHIKKGKRQIYSTNNDCTELNALTI